MTDRSSGRAANELRNVQFTRHYTIHAEGSVLVSFGQTKVLCTASTEERVPAFLRGKGRGWVTAEYGMLPRSTGTRMAREASRGRQSGRTLEIQRLIGRSLRAAADLKALGERTITIDCDVLQADGGTRTAAITGGYLALVDACAALVTSEVIDRSPIEGQIASVSVGIVNGTALLDLDYVEDSSAETDMNVVMDAEHRFIEVQGTAESRAFTEDQMHEMLALARQGIGQLLSQQNESLNRG